MNAVETIIIQAILKSVTDYNNSIKILEPGVKKYFNDHFDDILCHLYEWHLVDNGNNIEIMYKQQYLNGAIEYKTDIVTTETIVSIAVELSFNKN